MTVPFSFWMTLHVFSIPQRHPKQALQCPSTCIECDSLKIYCSHANGKSVAFVEVQLLACRLVIPLIRQQVSGCNQWTYFPDHATWLVVIRSKIMLSNSALALQADDACWFAVLQCSGSGLATLHCKARLHSTMHLEGCHALHMATTPQAW